MSRVLGAFYYLWCIDIATLRYFVSVNNIKPGFQIITDTMRVLVEYLEPVLLSRHVAQCMAWPVLANKMLCMACLGYEPVY